MALAATLFGLSGLYWVVPALIRSAHAGRIPALQRFIPSRSSVPVERYLVAWGGIAEVAVFLAVITVPLLFLGLVLWWHTRPARRIPDEEGVLRDFAPGASSWLYATWFGLIAGVGEGAYGLLKVALLGEFPSELKDISVHAVWMSSVGHIGINLIVCLSLLGLARRFSGPSLSTVPAFTFPFFAFLSWMGATGRIHPAAALLLAAGLAVRLAGREPFRSGALAQYMRGTLPVGLAAMLVFSVALPVGRSLSERADRDALAPSADKPNVVLLVLDTQRAFNMSLYGYERPTTPGMAELSRRGVVFERAISPAPWTLPAHASLFTGRWPHELRVGFNSSLDDTYPTLAERLVEHGYVTGGFSANLVYATPLWGLGRGFHHFDAVPISVPATAKQTWLIRWPWLQVRKLFGAHDYLVLNSAERVNTWFLDWESRREGRPFFAFLNLFEPHEPYDPPDDLAGLFGSTPGGINWVRDGNNSADYTDEQLSEMVSRYDEDVVDVDRAVVALISSLEERGLMDNTIVIITADHGEEFGEHGFLNHVETVHTPSVHVPLIVLSAGVGNGGLRVPTPVSTRDVAATILEMTGAPSGGIPGVSLSRFWTGGDTTVGPILTELGEIRSVFSDLHLIRRPNGEEQLYDWLNDPLELEDISESRPADRARMADLLTALYRDSIGGPGEGQ